MTDTPQDIAIQRIYLKDLSFESPMAPKVFQKSNTPQINLELSSVNKQLAADLYEVELHLTATATEKENKDDIWFIVEVEMAGIFQLKGFEGDELAHLLGAYCPNVLFPYARENVDQLTVRGTFPPLNIMPINFDAMYRAQKNQSAPEPR